MKKYLIGLFFFSTVMTSCKKNCYECKDICVVLAYKDSIVCSSEFASYSDFMQFTGPGGVTIKGGYVADLQNVCDDESEVERYRSMSYYCEKKK